MIFYLTNGDYHSTTHWVNDGKNSSFFVQITYQSWESFVERVIFGRHVINSK